MGREILYYYLSVPLLTFVNDGIFSLRILSVFCNLITIAASMALGRAMFRGRRGVVVGLVVGVLMTLSFPMIWLSRQAFRSSTLPLMQSLARLWDCDPSPPPPLPHKRGRENPRGGSFPRSWWGVRGRGGLYLQLVAPLFPF